MPELGGFLKSCPDAATDVAATANWFNYWKGQGEMKVYSTAYKNVVGNMDTIKADVKIMETDFDKQDFYGTASHPYYCEPCVGVQGCYIPMASYQKSF